jgi:L-proline amide hydrolase
MQNCTTGYMSFNTYKTFYKVFGSPNSPEPPLLILHGGPGSAHNYLLGLSELARTKRQVIFYDQLGGGLSDHPKEGEVEWGFNIFIDELNAIREHLKLKHISLLGHSWGGMLAAEYMSRQPEGIEKVIFASSMINMPLYAEEVDILKKDLPHDANETLFTHEKAGTTKSAAYKKAMEIYDARHIFRGKEYPALFKDPKGTFGATIYETLWGVSEAYPNGMLKNWSRIADLQNIHVPTLVTSGQYDELTPRQAIEVYESLPNAKLHIITAGSHLAHIEYPEMYLSIVEQFLHSSQ